MCSDQARRPWNPGDPQPTAAEAVQIRVLANMIGARGTSRCRCSCLHGTLHPYLLPGSLVRK